MSAAPGTSTGADPIIVLDGVSKFFAGRGRGEASVARGVRAVDDVSLRIARGEVFGVVGYSGAGKSTLVRLINALERADAGTIDVDGRRVTELGERGLRDLRADIGMVFQQFNLFGARTVARNVEYPLRLAGWSRDRRRARVAELLEFVGLSDKARSYPAQLSGGQKQRVGIARALATSPHILLADEATSALDPETTRDVLDLLRRVNRELGVTIVVITHEMSVVQYVCHKVAVMEDGKVVEHGDVYQIFADPQTQATCRFIQTALKDRPAPDVVARLRERHPGRLVVVTLPDTGRGFDVTAFTTGLDARAAVVYGGVTEVGDRPFGSLTLELTGPQTEDAVTRLRDAAPVVDLGTAADPLDDARWVESIARKEGA
ncbi:methionine ABC transporter ATP-binding protein [Luteimicrobium xylanilyticum]|uniref:Methionine import ATP-binding protein MetN n=1 Tax=Luteimicrobium xylanilyticum TaxID=1133546 RepID=A0A5P9QF71_9MICO|nr:methionine ABC transporter ATP-binding protein [Luteimicrobium xylanilyticum]QFU99906.1 Methionine import ATP-binding protein MetN [Luteimicrobium xylanilyticum]